MLSVHSLYFYSFANSCRILRTSANILVINLAISDFFMLAKSPIYIYNCLKFGPALGDFGKFSANFVHFVRTKKKNKKRKTTKTFMHVPSSVRMGDEVTVKLRFYFLFVFAFFCSMSAVWFSGWINWYGVNNNFDRYFVRSLYGILSYFLFCFNFDSLKFINFHEFFFFQIL